MSELRDQLRAEVKKIIDEPDGPLPEFPIKPPEIETENIFDPELEKPDPKFLEDVHGLIDNPMNMVMSVLTSYLDSMKPRIPEPIKSEHKVRIFQVNNWTNSAEIAAEIETLLNDGYCCYMPTVINDYVIMDFSRRKDDKRQERQANNDRSDKENTI